jgi:hypothetical protein
LAARREIVSSHALAALASAARKGWLREHLPARTGSPAVTRLYADHVGWNARRGIASPISGWRSALAALYGPQRRPWRGHITARRTSNYQP